MRIGLWSDCHNFPNLCLMKLSAYHKAQGDSVEFADSLTHYDRVYCSKTFTFTPDAESEARISADEILRGGTGYENYKSKLPDEIEHTCPDYSLYPQYKFAVGFTTRGCPRNCPFCVVTQKEGARSEQVADLTDFWRGQKEIKLLDPNLLACKDREAILEQLAKSGAWIDFTQGLDIRLATPDIVPLLNRVKVKMLHFAWDDPKQDLTPFFHEFNKATNITDYRRKAVYVLTNYWSTTEQDLYRIYTLRELGFDAYVMIYNKHRFIDENTHKLKPMQELLKDFTAEQIHHYEKCAMLQRWNNSKRIIRKCPRFENYNPKLG